jgi:hypothetical protein
MVFQNKKDHRVNIFFLSLPLSGSADELSVTSHSSIDLDYWGSHNQPLLSMVRVGGNSNKARWISTDSSHTVCKLGNMTIPEVPLLTHHLTFI